MLNGTSSTINENTSKIGRNASSQDAFNIV